LARVGKDATRLLLSCSREIEPELLHNSLGASPNVIADQAREKSSRAGVIFYRASKELVKKRDPSLAMLARDDHPDRMVVLTRE
jgi:hypothetical protein